MNLCQFMRSHRFRAMIQVEMTKGGDDDGNDDEGYKDEDSKLSLLFVQRFC